MHDLPESKPGLRGRLYQWLARATSERFRYFPSAGRYNLTVSHTTKFVWFRVAKVGTRSIFQLLREAGVKFDIENGIFLHYAPNAWRDHLKFAFVRNPWERFVSAWHDRVVDRNHFGFDPEEHRKLQEFPRFVEFAESWDVRRCDVHFRLQSCLIDLGAMDFLGRMEHFETDVSALFRRLHLPERPLARANKSSREGDYRSAFTDDLAVRVRRLYERDIQIFGYDF